MLLPAGAKQYGSSWVLNRWLVCLDRNPDVPGGRNVVMNIDHVASFYHKSAEPSHTVVVMDNGHSYDVDEDINNIMDALSS